MPGRRTVIVLVMLECLAAEAEENPADLVLRGGKIVTLDDRQPTATALATRGDRILVVGDDETVRPRIGPNTRVIELQGKLTIPGFIEGHGHFLGLGESKRMLDLSRVRSWEEITRLVKEAAAKATPGLWILGRGWHQSKWDRAPEANVEGYPMHEKLSRAAPNHPVLLTHASGHMTLANAWRSLLDAGAVIVNGTDAPVEEVDPVRSFYAGVTRRLDSGATFFPEQRMTRLEALRSYTASPAYAAFEESLKGSLTPGKLADIVVLSEDILSVPEEKVLQARVLYTIVGGKVLLDRGQGRRTF